MTHFSFFVVTLLGKTEVPGDDIESSRLLLRLFTPVLKATVAKTAVAFLSECMECLGGQGYVEEGGIAVLYRDTQVNAIWEGTTNVLANDLLRVLQGKSGKLTLEALDSYIASAVRTGESCEKLKDLPQRFNEIYQSWRSHLTQTPADMVFAHARDLTLRLGQLIGAMELMIDAASDGNDIEIECCRRVFNLQYDWDEDETDRDRQIVFGRNGPAVPFMQARL